MRFSVGDWDIVMKGSRPQGISVEISTRCNLSCIHCFRLSSPAIPYGDMDYSDFRAVVDNAVESGVRRVVLTGWGEPTLNPYLLDMLSYAKSRGLEVALNTNGTKLYELADSLIRLGVDELYVSVDAVDVELYGRIRGRGDLPAVSRGIARVGELKRGLCRRAPSVKVLLTVTKLNVGQVPLVVDYAAGLEVEEVYLSYFIPHSGASEYLDCYSDSECVAMFRQAVGEALSRVARYPGLHFKLWVPGAGGYSQRSCPYVDRRALHVRVDGRVSPCLFMAYSWETRIEGVRRRVRGYTIGNALRERLSGIWGRNGELYFKHFFRLMPTCLDCDLRTYCSYSADTEYDCWGNSPNCSHCPYYYKLSYCPL